MRRMVSSLFFLRISFKLPAICVNCWTHCNCTICLHSFCCEFNVIVTGLGDENRVCAVFCLIIISSSQYYARSTRGNLHFQNWTFHIQGGPKNVDALSDSNFSNPGRHFLFSYKDTNLCRKKNKKYLTDSETLSLKKWNTFLTTLYVK